MLSIDALLRKRKTNLSSTSDKEAAPAAVSSPSLLIKKPFTALAVSTTATKQQRKSAKKNTINTITKYFVPVAKDKPKDSIISVLQDEDDLADDEEETLIIPKVRPHRRIYYIQFEQIMNDFFNDDYYDVDVQDECSIVKPAILKRKRSSSIDSIQTDDNSNAMKKRAISELSSLFESSLTLNARIVLNTAHRRGCPRALITEVADDDNDQQKDEARSAD